MYRKTNYIYILFMYFIWGFAPHTNWDAHPSSGLQSGIGTAWPARKAPGRLKGPRKVEHKEMKHHMSIDI